MSRRAAAVEALAATLVLAFACYVLGYRLDWKGPDWTPISTGLWPFYVAFQLQTVWDRAAAPLLAALPAWLVARAWLRDERASLSSLLGLVAVAHLFHLACGVSRHGVIEGLSRQFASGNEYWNDVRYVGAGFLARFPDVGGPLSQHGATHPPGLTLVLAGVARLGFSERLEAEVVCSTAAALAALPLWAAARRLGGEDVARFAVLFLLFACSATVYAVMAMDTVTLLLVATAWWGFTRALDGDAPGGLVWGAAFALATFCHFLAAMNALAWGVVLLSKRANLDGRRWRALALGPTAFLSVYALLVLGFAYRPLYVFERAYQRFVGSEDPRRDRLHALVGAPLAFLGALGWPLFALAGRSLGGALLRLARGRDLGTAALVLAPALPWLVPVALGKPRGEVDHIFLMFVPGTAFAVALAARRWYQRTPRWLTGFALPALLLQSIATEIFFETYW